MNRKSKLFGTTAILTCIIWQSCAARIEWLARDAQRSKTFFWWVCLGTISLLLNPLSKCAVSANGCSRGSIMPPLTTIMRSVTAPPYVSVVIQWNSQKPTDIYLALKCRNKSRMCFHSLNEMFETGCLASTPERKRRRTFPYVDSHDGHHLTYGTPGTQTRVSIVGARRQLWNAAC
ncbi:hypothetical protein IWX47DRAFT_389411 [Phyllosticta citricarpa]